MTSSYLLDANIISKVMQKDELVAQNLVAAVASNKRIILSPVADYEITRGLLNVNATRKLREYRSLVSGFSYTSLTREVWEKAAEHWVSRRKAGIAYKNDGDVLLGAQADVLGAVLVTDNEKHFTGIGIAVVNWVQSP